MLLRKNIMLDLSIRTGHCRFEGIGDWVTHDEITVIPLGDWRYEFLVGLHELIEAQLCKARGISPQMVDEFDSKFIGEGEPGDSPDCPYRKEHAFATCIEMLVCNELGINFSDYDRITNLIGELNEHKTD